MIHLHVIPWRPVRHYEIPFLIVGIMRPDLDRSVIRSVFRLKPYSEMMHSCFRVSQLVSTQRSCWCEFSRGVALMNETTDSWKWATVAP